MSVGRRVMDRVPIAMAGLVERFLFVGLAWAELGFRPKSVLGWLMLLLCGPILWFALSLLGEAAAEGFQHLPGLRHAREAVVQRTKGRQLSGLRILYLVVELLLVAGLVGGLMYLFGLA
jgi:hypothetical protein